MKQKTEENRERNELAVKIKTAQNDDGANFGPFSRNMVVLNIDGEMFTLLAKPQAMRLKELGYIKNKQFVKQPTQEVLDEAAEPSEFVTNFKNFFGSKEEDF